jgi:prolyl-tRNA editing enzyme YbaK/EbsC (Cys-tRNA(Pro) deacylase)
MPATTRTAADAAAACGCTVGQIIKSLIFKGSSTGSPYLLLVSGTNRVDEEAVAKRLGESVMRPDAAFVRDATGYAIGGVPPFGHQSRLVPYLDRDLLQYETVWAAAGTPNAVFAVDPAKLREAVGATVIAMGREA